jgi:hypothetical protein
VKIGEFLMNSLSFMTTLDLERWWEEAAAEMSGDLFTGDW